MDTQKKFAFKFSNSKFIPEFQFCNSEFSNTALYLSSYEEYIWNIRILFHASKVTFSRNAAPFAALILRIINQKILWCSSNVISLFHSVQFHHESHRSYIYLRVIHKVITDRKASHLVSTVNRERAEICGGIFIRTSDLSDVALSGLYARGAIKTP